MLLERFYMVMAPTGEIGSVNQGWEQKSPRIRANFSLIFLFIQTMISLRENMVLVFCGKRVLMFGVMLHYNYLMFILLLLLLPTDGLINLFNLSFVRMEELR